MNLESNNRSGSRRCFVGKSLTIVWEVVASKEQDIAPLLIECVGSLGLLIWVRPSDERIRRNAIKIVAAS